MTGTKTIKQILASLSKEDYEQLMTAFEDELTNQYVVYTQGRFVGVNIQENCPFGIVEQRAGYFSEGILRAETN